jgi:sulfonate transport system substrate-binding protein
MRSDHHVAQDGAMITRRNVLRSLPVSAAAATARAEPARQFRIGYQKNGILVEAVIDELAKVVAWSNAHRGEVAQLMADGTGVPLDAMQRAVARSTYVIGPMTGEIVRQQQQVADRFQRLGLIPTHVDIADITWRPTA